jgi:uncharacterized membrane protein YoaK (UPF0700 family)
MVFRTAGHVTMRRRYCVATASEVAKAEKREWSVTAARSLSFCAPAIIGAVGTRFLHLAAALLADMFIAHKSSTPHTEPAMDGRRFGATTAIFFL